MPAKRLERVQAAGLVLTVALHVLVGLFSSFYFESGWSSWSSLARLERRPNAVLALSLAGTAIALAAVVLWLSRAAGRASRRASIRALDTFASGRRVTLALAALSIDEAVFALTTLRPDVYNSLRPIIWGPAVGALAITVISCRAFLRGMNDPAVRAEWDRLMGRPAAG